MSLGERIKERRTNAHLSQEKLAELVGVSRQAVTKWESDLSAPSTENLFKLAEIFGTTVDMIVSTDDKNSEKSDVEKFFELYKAAEEQKKNNKREKYLRHLRDALIVSLLWLVLFLLCRFVYTDLDDQTVKSWLFSTSPRYTDYLFGWLISSNLYLYSSIISIIPAFFGKFRFSLVTVAGFALGLFIGEPLGVYPAGEVYGHGHYGWAIWGCIFIASVIGGIVCKKIEKKRKSK